MRAGARPITGPAGRGGAERSPRRVRSGLAGGACAGGRARSEERGSQCGSAAAAAASLFFRRTLGAFQESGGQAGGDRGTRWGPKPSAGGEDGMAGTGRRAGRSARCSWREPSPRSSRAGAGRALEPSLNQFKTPSGNGFNCRALLPARKPRPGRPALGVAPTDRRRAAARAGRVYAANWAGALRQPFPAAYTLPAELATPGKGRRCSPDSQIAVSQTFPRFTVPARNLVKHA